MPFATTTSLLAPGSIAPARRSWSRPRAAGSHSHRAVIVRARVEDVPARVIGDAHQRVVRRILVFVAIRHRLSEAVELGSGYLVGVTARQRFGNLLDRRQPGRLRLPRRRVEHDARITEHHHLPRRQKQRRSRVRYAVNLGQTRSIPLVDRSARAENQHVSTRFQRGDNCRRRCRCWGNRALRSSPVAVL